MTKDSISKDGSQRAFKELVGTATKVRWVALAVENKWTKIRWSKYAKRMERKMTESKAAVHQSVKGGTSRSLPANLGKRQTVGEYKTEVGNYFAELFRLEASPPEESAVEMILKNPRRERGEVTDLIMRDISKEE